MLHSLLLINAVGCVLSVPLQVSVEEQKCGYKSCHETPAGVLNVHIVPHTHDDVGWLKTVDQYYYGSRNNIQKAGVQYIIDSVIKELWEDPKRRFIYVETAFFWKWWVRQTEDVQQKVHTLVKEGRLQFVGGAWSMNDEANVHYQTTIDQFTWGLSKLNETFGHCARPRVGWQIDPFGHSKEFASLISMMGYDGLFLGRIDYQDKIARKRDKRMEMVWRGDEALGKPSDIFTGVLYNTYSPPPGFCFDVLCNDEPIIDDPDSPMFNVDTKVTQFLEICRNMSLSYKSNNILITMGEDFNYQDAAMWFTNLDKLIEYSNLKAAKEGLNISMFYSTPTCYLKAVKEADPVLPTKTDDFFPYASDESAYWTGYFTSRPTTKFFEREGNNYLQMVKQLQVLAGLEKHNQFVINELKSAMGVMQHHDAITGTEKQHVTHDYERLLDQAIEDALIVARQAFNKLTQGDATKPPIFDYQRCRLNESSCQVSETSDQFIVTLYNPLAWRVTEVFRIPVVGENYEVYAPDGKIEIEVIPISQVVINIPTRTSNATHELVFILELKPLSYKSLYIKKSSKTKRNTNDYDFYTFWTKKTPIINNFDDAIIKNYNYDTKNDESSDKNEDFEDSTMKPYTDIVKIDDGDHKNDDLNGDGTTIKPYTDIVKIDDDKYSVTTQKPAAATKKSVTKKRTKQTAIYNDKIAENNDKFARNHDEIAKNGDDITEIGDDTPKYGDKNTVNDNEKIPLAPISKPSLENPSPEIFDDMNFHILKDGINDGSLTELEKFIRESRRKIEKERDRVKIEYPALNAEEMRMLSDEPKVVERFDDEVIWDNQIFKLHIDDTGLKSITINDKQLKLESNMLYYPGTAGHNEVPSDRASGAYILRPSQTNPIPLKPIKTERITSDIVKEIRTELTENGYMNLKMYKNLPFIDIEWVVGPIPITDDTGKEYILSHQSDIFNNGEFYTDLTGRQALKRRLNYRPEWNLTLVEPVAGNYYPITSYIYIENDDFRINVLPDRPEGGSSLREGEIELMLHRRLLFDDAFGVGEPLNETANNLGLVVRGNQRLIISKDCNFVRQNVINYYHRPQVLFSDTSISLNDWLKLNNEFSFMGKFPYGLHLLTLEPWDDKLLVRIENYLEESRLSDVEIDLQSIFKNVRINNVKETMLSANIWAEDYNQWEWRKERDLGGKKERNTRIEGNKVKLSAKQIRTFIVDYDIV